MQKTWKTIVLTVFCLVFFTAASAQAQFWPGYWHTGGGYGAWGAYTSAMENNATRYIAQQNFASGQRIAAQQNASLQNNIRNTLSTQAEMRTQNQLSQDQANRDWWFNVQQQQLAQRQQLGPGAAAAEMAAPVVVPQSSPEVKTDIIQWPPVLREARFAEQRAMVEAPYRRNPGKPTNPTAEDYENMVKATEQMKILLGEMTAQISAQEYLQGEHFIRQLAEEARARLDKSDKK